KFDAIVSPANSYGRMDGAFDDAISKLLSPPTDYFALTRFVQAELYKEWKGFAVPGSASALLLPDNVIDAQKGTTDCKYLILCPTMHWPQDISWNRDIVYNVVWALLAEITRHNSDIKGNTEYDSGSQTPRHDSVHEKPLIRSVLMPGLGVGTGKIPYDRFAMQFALAVKNFDEAIRMPAKWSSLEWEDVQSIIKQLENTWSE
ncbi:macro domain-like protein, partial [Fomitiporia mediterranea MF3/22]